MNPNEYLDLDRRMKELEDTLTELKSMVRRYQINLNQREQNESKLTPGVGCKVAYDASGHIIRAMVLEPQDIPELPTSKIIGLSELKTTIDEQIAKLRSEIPSEKGTRSVGIAGTACKVNYDSTGRVMSGSGLTVEDIPELPLEKIKGLQDTIQSLNSQESSSGTSDVRTPVKPSTACKVTYDKDGRIVRSDELGMNDLPRELIDRINNMENLVLKAASSEVVNTLSAQVSRKADANTPITPGTYTKVIVDSAGFVRRGLQLTAEDLPEIRMSDIDGLTKALRDKVDHSAFLELSGTVNSFSSSIAKINEVVKVKDQLDSKVDRRDYESLSTLVDRIKNQVEDLIRTMPNDTIQDQIDVFTSDLSTLSGRISTIETILKISN